jgi:hypothetical protein
MAAMLFAELGPNIQESGQSDLSGPVGRAGEAYILQFGFEDDMYDIFLG